MTRVLLTPEGAQRLHEELQRLKRIDRPAIIEAIAEARAHGDLSENAEYHAAREQQGFIEGRIAELDAKLAMAEVIDPTRLNPRGKVIFGAWVELWEEEGDREVCYRIVGELEANIGQGMISHASPIAKALIGKAEGDEVEFQAPGGKRRYEVLSVRYQIEKDAKGS
ncbi:MAG TPA: transcription elongation factor GreA [Gammaproteobacteria bacterium]|nr:transcription elongation factor GreA [Gammaproteobacteria bacterium]